MGQINAYALTVRGGGKAMACPKHREVTILHQPVLPSFKVEPMLPDHLGYGGLVVFKMKI